MRTFVRNSFAIVALAVAAGAAAQAPKGLTADDETAIQSLVSRYAQALGSCDAEGFADLFAPTTGYFASGFRGVMVGRERLIALVQSERQCIAPTANAAPRPGGSAPKVVLDVTSSGVHGVVDLGRVGEYQDDYVKTSQGWRFGSRTVIIAAEKAAGLDAKGILAIRDLSGSELGDNYSIDANGVKRLLTSGVAISVADGVVKGRAYFKDGSHDEDIYEKAGPGKWRIQSRTHVPAAAP